MPYTKHVHEYRKTAVNSASPIQLIVMLYDGALRFIDQGREAMRRGDTYEQNTCLQKAQKIVAELLSCLDLAKGGEIAQNLFALYTYCYNNLVEANVEDRTEPLDQAAKVLESLRESWVELEFQHRNVPVASEEPDDQDFKLAA